MIFSWNPHLNDIAIVLYKWLEGDNADKAEKYGDQLYTLRRHMPEEVFKIPFIAGSTLYRVMLVQDEVLDRCINEHKPIILKNREYSSWTYFPRAAEDFGFDLEEPGFTLTIFHLETSEWHSFEIINILRLLEFLISKDVRGAESHKANYESEREIVLRNTSKSFEFRRDNIYEYRDAQDNWSHWRELIKR